MDHISDGAISTIIYLGGIARKFDRFN